MTDEEVVSLVQKGDKEKYGEIVERYEGKLFWYIHRLTNQPSEEIEDLLQEVFINAYVNIREFESKRKFSSWIYRIAHNKAVDFIKKKRFKNVLAIDEDNEEWLLKDEKLEEELEIEREDREKLRKAINKLELNYREVIDLYFFEEKTYEEISEILRVPISNVGVLLFRAKIKLKKLLVESRKSKV